MKKTEKEDNKILERYIKEQEILHESLDHLPLKVITMQVSHFDGGEFDKAYGKLHDKSKVAIWKKEGKNYNLIEIYLLKVK